MTALMGDLPPHHLEKDRQEGFHTIHTMKMKYIIIKIDYVDIYFGGGRIQSSYSSGRLVRASDLSRAGLKIWLWM